MAEWVGRVRRERVPEPPAFATVRRLLWNGVEQPTKSVAIKLDGPELHVDAVFDVEDILHFDDPAPLHLDFVDGSSLDAAKCWTSGDSATHGGTALLAFEWHWRKPGAQVAVWMMRARGAFGGLSPNLWIADVGRSGLWLEGQHRYAVQFDTFDGAKECDIVMFTDGVAPQRTTILDDLLVLSFAFGTPVRVDHVVGLAADGSVVEVVSEKMGGDFVDRRFQPEPPVPRPLAPNQPTWIAPLFAKVSAAVCADRAMRVPLLYYVEATERPIIDMECLDLHMSLEALANWHLKKSGPPGPSRTRVERAFQSFGFTLLPGQLTALKDRHACAHEALMNGGLNYNFAHDTRRVALARTMLAALISLVSGYRGALMGWDRDRSGFMPAPASWWPVAAADEQRALTVYRADPR